MHKSKELKKAVKAIQNEIRDIANKTPLTGENVYKIAELAASCLYIHAVGEDGGWYAVYRKKLA
jgi:hypothetical protein